MDMLIYVWIFEWWNSGHETRTISSNLANQPEEKRNQSTQLTEFLINCWKKQLINNSFSEK